MNREEDNFELEKFDYGQKEINNIELVKRIHTIRDAQNLNMKKTLDRFFQEPTIKDSIALEAANFPDYETMNVVIIVVVFYIWAELKERKIPKNVVSASEAKLKKGEARIAPDLTLQKEYFKTENVTPELKADIYRYMRYILHLSKIRS